MKKNLKILDGLDNTLPTTPHLLYLDEKNKFLEISGILGPPRNFLKFPEILIRPRTLLEWGKLNRNINITFFGLPVSHWCLRWPSMAFQGLSEPFLKFRGNYPEIFRGFDADVDTISRCRCSDYYKVSCHIIRGST